jgi:hypothetical protein
MLDVVYKLYAKIISGISVIRKILLIEEQNGFKSGRSCMHSFSTVQQLLETHKNVV